MDKTMKITGKGKVSVKPDIIRLNMTMEESYKEYEVTLSQSSETTKILKELFVSLGFNKEDLKTRSFDIDTKYESYKAKDQSWKKKLVGYTYTHRMLIEFDADNKKLGKILYALAHGVITPEISIEYTVSDPEKHKDELLKNAIEDSKHKAEVLANAADIELDDIVSIDYSWGEISFVSEPIQNFAFASAEQTTGRTGYDIDIEADDIDVTDTVTVIWNMK
ncbi:SIMPL domain-containing protein [uncultured Catenibacterium sp.]|uniref:SIMPL domain-containing protein n=1 Tax=uncultured Catenibacterium sp. TaxID=286142 RepID=UPI0025F93D09|nr:SIMPL domain-containing protein [uncultured Catenibacterium sp.]